MSRAARERKSPSQLWGIWSLQSLLALATGRLDEASELIDRGFPLGERALGEHTIPVYRLQRYTLHDYAGRLEDVGDSIAELVTSYPARPAFRCVLAHLHARLGELDASQRILDDFAAGDFSALPFDLEWLYGISFLAETAALLGDADAAATLHGLLAPWSRLHAVDYPEGFRGSIARYLGMLAATTRRWDEAERQFEDAIAMNTKTGARPWLAHSQSDLAEMLLARGDPGDAERALELVEHASAAYREMGMQTWAERASSLVRRDG